MEREYGPAVAEREKVEVRPRIVTARAATVGSLTAAACGFVALALAVLGLAGAAPTWMASIGVTLVGLSLLVGGGLIGAQYSGEVERPYAGVRWGTIFAAAAGAVGIALGILGIVNVVPYVLLPVASIVFGTAFLAGSAGLYLLNSLIASPEGGVEPARWAVRDFLTAALGAEALIGLAGIGLGIVALALVDQVTLSLVAVLCLGAGLAIGGPVLAIRLVRQSA